MELTGIPGSAQYLVSQLLYHSRIKVHFVAIFLDKFSKVFVRAFQTDGLVALSS